MIAQVNQFAKALVRLLADHIALKVDLDGSCAIGDMGEGRSTHHANGHQPPRHLDLDLSSLGSLFKGTQGLDGCVRPLDARGVGIDTRLAPGL
jgi:hypothetical protein